MIDMMYIRGFYPPHIADNAVFQKHILKEYVELLALEWITRSEYAKKLVFIGGTCLRLVYGIDRFVHFFWLQKNFASKREQRNFIFFAEREQNA